MKILIRQQINIFQNLHRHRHYHHRHQLRYLNLPLSPPTRPTTPPLPTDPPVVNNQLFQVFHKCILCIFYDKLLFETEYIEYIIQFVVRKRILDAGKVDSNESWKKRLLFLSSF